MKVNIWFDGSCLPTTPGKTTIGACIVKNERNEVLYTQSAYEEHDDWSSNNYAEYKGLELGLNWVINNKEQITSVQIYGDSNMVIQQMSGKWRIKKGVYVPIAKRTIQKVVDHRLGSKLSFKWIPREMNTEADELTR